MSYIFAYINIYYNYILTTQDVHVVYDVCYENQLQKWVWKFVMKIGKRKSKSLYLQNLKVGCVMSIWNENMYKTKIENAFTDKEIHDKD